MLTNIESGLRASVQYTELVNVFNVEPRFAEAELRSRFTEAGYTVYGIRYTVYGIRYKVYGIRYTVYGIRYTV